MTNIITCPRCGTENKATQYFCGNCRVNLHLSKEAMRELQEPGEAFTTTSGSLGASQSSGSQAQESSGVDLRLTLPDEAKRAPTVSARSTGSGYEIHETRYPALHAVGSAYAFLGWLVIIGGILFGITSVALSSREGGFGAGVVAGIVSVLGGVVLGLPMLACRDVIRWMFDLQGHAGRSEELLDRLTAGR